MVISFEISKAIVDNQFNVLILIMTFDIINHMFCIKVLIGNPAPLELYGFTNTLHLCLLFSSDKYYGAIFLNEIISHTLSKTIYHIGF